MEGLVIVCVEPVKELTRVYSEKNHSCQFSSFVSAAAAASEIVLYIRPSDQRQHNVGSVWL